MNEYWMQKTPFERLLLLAGGIYLGAKVIDSLFPPNDTVNYELYNKGILKYHGITYEDRLDNRLAEHEVNGKVFDFCLYDAAKPRQKALKLEKKRVRRDRPCDNKQHNCY